MFLSRRSLLRLLAAFSLGSFVSPIPSFADGDDSGDSVLFTSEVAWTMADAFAKNNIGDDASACEPIPMYDLAGSPLGYLVCFERDGAPHGHIVYDAYQPGLVVRYSLDEGVGVPTQGASDAAAQTLSDNGSFSLVMVNPLEFGRLDEGSGLAFFPDGTMNNLGISLCSGKTTSWEELMIDQDYVYGSPYKITDSSYVGDYWFVTEEQLEENIGHYACAVTALYTIAGLTQGSNGFLINPFEDYAEYLNLWNYTSTSSLYVKNNVLYGSTSDENIGLGFKRFCAYKNHDISYSAAASPQYATFQKVVNERRHSVFSARITKSNGTVEGHSMSVAGWATLNNGSNNVNTLLVYDGWSKCVYLNLSYSGYVSTHGTFF